MTGRNLVILAATLLAAGMAVALWPSGATDPVVAPLLPDEEARPELPPEPRAATEPTPGVRAESGPAVAAPPAAPQRDVVEVRGRVLGKDDEPVAGARVGLELRIEDTPLPWLGTESAADGSYAFRVPLDRNRYRIAHWRQSGSLVVAAQCRGYWPGRVEAQASAHATAEPLRIDVRLDRGACVLFRVIDSTSKPVPNAAAVLVDESLGGRQVLWGSSTEPGRIGMGADFAIPITTAGLRMVEAQAEGAGTGKFGPVLVDPRSDVRLPDLVLFGEGRIAGMVVHSGGQAFEDLPLRVEPDAATVADTTRPGMVSGTVNSTRGGAFEFKGLRPGRYLVRPGGEPAEDSDPWFPTGTSDVRLVVRKSRLHVWVSTGGPEPGLTLACWSWTSEAEERARKAMSESAGPLAGSTPMTRGSVGPNTTWTGLVPTGSLVCLRLRAPDGRSKEEWLRATGGAEIWHSIYLPAPTTGGGAVVLRLADGKPWPTATTASLLPRRGGAARIALKASDAPDQLLASQVPAGRHQVRVEPDAGPANRMLAGELSVEVRAGETTTAVFTPVVGGRVQLTVFALSVDGTQPAGEIAVRSLVARKADGAAPLPLGDCVVVTSSGSWSIASRFTSGVPFLCARALPAGRHIVEIEPEGFGKASAVVDIVAGEVSRHELRVHVR